MDDGEHQAPDEAGLLPRSSLVRPYVESLGEPAPVPPPVPPSAESPWGRRPDVPPPVVESRNDRHAADTAAPDRSPPVDAEQAPGGVRRRVALVGAVVVAAAAVGGYLVWHSGGPAPTSAPAPAPGEVIAASVLASSQAPSSLTSPAASRSASPLPATPSLAPTPSSVPASTLRASVTPTPASTLNLAAGRSVQDTGHTGAFVAANAVDGDAGTYWQSKANAFPQSITVDLGAAKEVGRIVVSLPPGWSARTQRLSVLGSMNDVGFATISGVATYQFDPSAGNAVTIAFSPVRKRYVRLTFTANSGSPAAQASEIEIYAA